MAGKGWQLPSPAMHFFTALFSQFCHDRPRMASKKADVAFDATPALLLIQWLLQQGCCYHTACG
jgi:hypothetical protein